MREILFRGKRADNGEWVEGYLFSTVNHTYIVYADQYDDDLFFSPKNIFIAVDPETAEQYTGLTDKNGKKIFEGDILKGQYDEDSPEDIAILVVLWDNGWRTQQGDSVPDLLEELDCQICEVIGNIHDNPELLKGGEEDS